LQGLLGVALQLVGRGGGLERTAALGLQAFALCGQPVVKGIGIVEAQPIGRCAPPVGQRLVRTPGGQGGVKVAHIAGDIGREGEEIALGQHGAFDAGASPLGGARFSFSLPCPS